MLREDIEQEQKPFFYYQLESDVYLNTDRVLFFKEFNELISNIIIKIRFSPVFKVDHSKKAYEQEQVVAGKHKKLDSLLIMRYDNQTKDVSFNVGNIKGTDIKFAVVGFGKKQFKGNPKTLVISIDEYNYLISRFGHYINNEDNLECRSYSCHEIKFFKKYNELKLNSSYFAFYKEKSEVVIATYTNYMGVGECFWYINEINESYETTVLELTELIPVNQSYVEQEYKTS